MAQPSPKDYTSASNYPRSLSSIIISVGLLAVFITLASWILLSHPIGIVVRSYFYGVDETSNLGLSVSWEGAQSSQVRGEGKSDVSYKNLTKSEGEDGGGMSLSKSDGGDSSLRKSEGAAEPGQTQNVSDTSFQKSEDTGKVDENKSAKVSQEKDVSVSSGNDMIPVEQGTENPVPKEDRDSAKSEPSIGNADSKRSIDSDCDLYHGEWFFDPDGPLYTNNSCPIITQMQNCQGNGRPDKEYESWRWKPAQCELPRFNATKFLELMSGKTLAFVGDSVARNQMESLICLLWQVEVPKNRGSRQMHRWYFKSKSVMIVRIWSSWLVHHTPEAFGGIREGIDKLHLDVPDEDFMKHIPNFDVVVLSSGHWFAKQSIYLSNNEIVGTQLWAPPKDQPMKINNIEAFGISVETSMTAMVTHPNYTGLTILRAYSPDHYEGGAWNTGGSCTGKERPILPGQLVENEYTKSMYEQQVSGFSRAVKKHLNRSKLKLMDITEPFSYRHDGHPGPYRSPDPNKITKRGPDGKPPPQDCLHWCMPGPVDTWNEFVLETIRREFEANNNSGM